MSSDVPTDVLPILPGAASGFDVAMRGYDRVQVDHYVGQIEDDLRAAAADRDAAMARTADMAAQLASVHAQLESARRQLESATARVTDENIDDHIRAILATANADAAAKLTAADEEAAAIRAGAQEAAARLRGTSQAEADEVRLVATQRHADADETFRQRIAEAEQRRADIESELAARIEAVRTEEHQLTMAAQQARDAADTDANDRRTRADEDFEITLRKRRSIELEESERITSEAAATAERLVAEATERVRAIEAYRDALHEQLRSLHGDLGSTLTSNIGAAPTSVLDVAAAVDPTDEDVPTAQ